MNYALARPSNASRSGLLGIVIGLHVAVLLAIAAAKTVAPQLIEMPLIVDLIQPAEENRPQPKPQAVVKPQPVPVRVSAPKTPQAVLETTRSTQAAAAAVEAAPTPAPISERPAAAPAEPLSQARFDAAYLNNPAPAYPPLSRKLGEQGQVILRVSVSPQGTADSVDIKNSSGSPRLDEAAQRTVRNWKFVPAKRGETPVQSWVLVPINFKLEQ